MKLERHAINPVLLPDPNSDWDGYHVFNPSVIHHKGLFHMHYRAQGLDWVSRIGYAVSQDGVRWNRLRRSVLEPIFRVGSVTTGGDAILGTQDVRCAFSQGGAGAKVGIISDGVDSRADSQASRDLPAVGVHGRS